MLKWTVSTQSLKKAVQTCVYFHQQNTVNTVHQNRLSFLRKICVDRSVSRGITSFSKVQNFHQNNRLPVLMFSKNSSSLNNQQKTTEEPKLSQQNTSEEPKLSQHNTSEEPKLSNKDKLKRAVKDYGSTVFVFHIALSLTSLGISYLVISSGLDVNSLLDRVGLSSSELVAGAGTFAVAYAVHKVFAPVRISITLGATPFIVRYLRRVGILKTPTSK